MLRINTRNYQGSFYYILFFGCHWLNGFLFWLWLLLFWLWWLLSRNHLSWSKQKIVVFFLAGSKIFCHFFLFFQQNFKINFLFNRESWCYKSIYRVLSCLILRLLHWLSDWVTFNEAKNFQYVRWSDLLLIHLNIDICLVDFWRPLNLI